MNAVTQRVGTDRRRRAMKKIRTILASWQLYALLLPAFLYVLIFSYRPMYGVLIAFKDYQASLGVWGSEWVGLAHIRRFISYPMFWNIIRNTLSISLYSLATFPCSVVLALLINEAGSQKFKKTVQMITYAPYFISVVVLCSMVGLFFGRSMGLVNNILEVLGGARINFLERPEYFADLYVWSDVWHSVGWGTIIYIAALSSVSPELVEAAKIDGANRLHIIWYVNIPTIAPTIIIMLILSCGSILSVGFEKAYLLKNSLNNDTAQVISTYVYEVGLQGGQFSYSSAIGLFNTVVNLALLMVVNAVAKKAANISIW